MPADNSCVTLAGPWEHRLVQANGAQFHLAEAGTYTTNKPLVLLVHGFPQYWWAWRNQIEPLAAAGFHVAAIDRRGFGGSDKTPNSQDASILAADLAALVRALGYSQAVLVGHGRGAALSWSAVSSHAELFAGLVTVSSPHPRTLQRIGTHVTLRTWRHALTALVSPVYLRALTSETQVRSLLQEWSAPGNDGAASQAAIYTQAMQLPGAAELSLEQLRWMLFSQPRPSGRAYLRESAHAVHQPVLALRGKLDPLLPARAWHKDLEFARGTYRFVEIDDAGHFVPEEQPEEVTREILSFLAQWS